MRKLHGFSIGGQKMNFYANVAAAAVVIATPHPFRDARYIIDPSTDERARLVRPKFPNLLSSRPRHHRCSRYRDDRLVDKGIRVHFTRSIRRAPPGNGAAGVLSATSKICPPSPNVPASSPATMEIRDRHRMTTSRIMVVRRR